MIKLSGNFYLYRHIRLDRNEPFYVGIGSKDKSKRIDGYDRAYNKSNRTKYWKNITNKSQYEVEILVESDSYDFIKQKETEFISLYGRRNLGKGTLCNLTDGGEGVKGRIYICSEETREKMSIANKGKHLSQEAKDKLSKMFKGRVSPMKGKKQTQKFLIAISKANKGRIVSDITKEKLRSLKIGKPLKEGNYAWRYKKVDQFSKDGNFIKTWDNIRDASKYYNIGISEICVTCKANRGDYPKGHKSYNRKTCKGFIWKYKT